MCVIAVYENNYPNLEDLESMELMNSDGSGIAWIDNGKVHYSKGLNQKAKDIYNLIQENQIKLPIVIHFRIKSSGLICDELCHPFPINKKGSDKLENICDKVLFHNGTVYKWDDYLLNTCLNTGIKIPDGELSDSKALAFLCSIYGDNFLRLAGNNGKFVIFSKNGIKKYGDWIECSNGSCSNKFHVKETEKKYESEEKIKVRNSDIVNVWRGQKLVRIEKNGIILKDFENSKNDLTVIEQSDFGKEIDKSILEQVDELQIENMTDEQLKELHEKTFDEIDTLDGRLSVLRGNLSHLYKEDKTVKNDKKIKSTIRRIANLTKEKNVKTLILDDIMQIDNEVTTYDPKKEQAIYDQYGIY